MEKYKLFWKLGENPKQIYNIYYNDNADYYSFLQKQCDAGYRQVIISSEAMIALMKEATEKANLKVYDIELVEDDESLKNEIDSLIYMASDHKTGFNILINRLYFLSEESSIEIKRIRLNGRSESKEPIDMYLQSNGIVGYSAENNDLLSRISQFLQNFLFN